MLVVVRTNLEGDFTAGGVRVYEVEAGDVIEVDDANARRLLRRRQVSMVSAVIDVPEPEEAPPEAPG